MSYKEYIRRKLKKENTMIYMYMYYKLDGKVQSTIYYKLKYLQIVYVGGYQVMITMLLLPFIMLSHCRSKDA